jgi:hypothetical protein
VVVVNIALLIAGQFNDTKTRRISTSRQDAKEKY